MSVYQTKGSAFWLYDFERGGCRFSGSFNGLKGRPQIPKERPKREAERAEAVIRSTAGQPVTNKPRLTLHEGAARYWAEAAQDYADSSGEWGRLMNLERLLGMTTCLDALTDGDISHAVARRRVENARHKDTPVSPATVNRELECLGRILKRARKVWKVEVPDLDVSDHKLAEPRGRIRSLTTDEDTALFKAIAEVRPDFKDMVEFALLTTKRLSEVIFLEKRKIDRKAMEATVVQKGGQEIVIPLTKRTLAIVKRNWLNHPTRLFTYISRRKRNGVPKGKRYPFTPDGWRKSWAAILTKAKIEDFRFHDLRHTGATRVLAATGNLKAVQDALSHASIVSSARYAHTDSKQRRAALEAAEGLRVPKIPRRRR